MNIFCEMSLVVTPHGGEFSLADSVKLSIPPGAVDSPTEIRWRLLQSFEANRALFIRNVTAKHWAGRNINGTDFPGSPELIFVSGIEFFPSGLHFNEKIKVTIPAALGYQPVSPLQGEILPGFDSMQFLPTKISTVPLGEVNLLGETITQSLLEFEIQTLSEHVIVDMNWDDRAEECRNPATACRCLRVEVESGESLGRVGECAVQQTTTRVKFLDCPGQPVEEHTFYELSPECKDVEPIPDLLNYRPGKKWKFSYKHHGIMVGKQLEPSLADPTGNHNVDVKIEGSFEILPEMDSEGKQPLKGQATGTVSWVIEPYSDEDYVGSGDIAGPIAVPIEFKGHITWNFPLKPPGIFIFLTIKSGNGDADWAYIPVSSRGGNGWRSGVWKVGVCYRRIFPFFSIKFIEGSESHEYPVSYSVPAHGGWKTVEHSHLVNRYEFSFTP